MEQIYLICNAADFDPFIRIQILRVIDHFFIRNVENELLTFEVYANEKIGVRGVREIYEAASHYLSTVTLMTCEDELAKGWYAFRQVSRQRSCCNCKKRRILKSVFVSGNGLEPSAFAMSTQRSNQLS